MPNNWMRLERVGSVIYLYWSDDGKTWSMYNPYSPQGWDTAGSWPPGADNSTVAFFTNAWPSTIFLGLGVTAHNDSYTSTAVFSNFGPYTPVPIAITTQPAAKVSIAANNQLVLSVAATGDPVHYQWLKNGTPVPTNGLGASYTVPLAKTTDSGTYTVRVYGAGKEVVSAASVVTISQDTTPPTITGITADKSFTSISVQFSEPVTDSALTKGNYAINNGVTVSSVARSTDSKVILTTSKMTEGTQYTLTVNNVLDTATPANPIVPNTAANFQAAVFATGWASYERWNYTADPGGIDVLDAAIKDGSMAAPDVTSAVNEFGSAWGVADYYFARVSGYFVPPTNGNYVFFIDSDDQSYLYLSTDATPANKKLIAKELNWSNQYQFTTSGGGSDLTEKRSDQSPSTEWPTGNTITLKAGTRYYMEALLKEGSGGDGVDATYIKEGDSDPTNDSAGMHTRGSVIATFLDPNGASVTISQQPVATQGVDGKVARFTVAATGVSPYGSTVTYQWQKNGTDIAGATSASYTTPVLTSADSGSKFKVLVSVPTKQVASDEVVLTVVPDTFPPAVSVGALKNPAGTYDIGVQFDEPVDAAGAVQANYSISAGTVTAFKAYTNSPGAVLTVSGLTAGQSYTVTVKNVADLKGNKITSTTGNFTLGKMSWGVVGGDQLKLGNGVVAVGSSGFDIYSDGFGEWNNYDEATFAYEQITGDFDKKVRVEYQDLSSQWARAGLVMREVTNFGVDAVAQTGDSSGAVSNATGTPPYSGSAGRYQKIHVNPVGPTMTGPGTAGNQSWEGNRRLDVGGPSSSALTGVNSIPQYPNAWCRLQRQGQTFTIYRSDDGVNWVNLGSTTWPDAADPSSTPMPATVYVGPEFSPENGNITDTASYGVWLAKFREYGDTVAVNPTGPTLSLARTSTGVTVTFTGTLQSADKVSGPWADVTGSSPQVLTTSGAAKFYRAKQ